MLAVIGTIWAVGGDTSLNSSASGDTETERTRRQRRAIVEVRNTNAQRQEFVDRHNAVRRDITKAYGKTQELAANMMRMVSLALSTTDIFCGCIRLVLISESVIPKWGTL